ncbi:hypothetical protein SG0754 [Sodalis glossinidius str. 'morsitans']|uniref:Uncharacterized protein n=1 Tax=Sodalis glossinidius (strain morsitans) TaxID=343509 RepID=Q2NUZ6_SODGM|nr:hypothetical protein SG0754 [Sodalis glossinidius str. 'morsitans']
MRKMKALLDAQEKQLQSRRLKVGFAAGATYPDGTSVPVVVYTNEVGRPEKRQPPRPFFHIAIAEHQVDWVRTCTRALRAGVDTDTALNLVGEQAVADVQTSILALSSPPLAQKTLYRRRTRQSPPKNLNDDPLVDTRVMLNSVTHWVGGEDEPA